MENVEVVNQVEAVEACPSEEVQPPTPPPMQVEAPKKRGRKPKAPTPTPEPTPEPIVVEQAVAEALPVAKAKARKPRVAKKSIEVIPIDQETVQVSIEEDNREPKTPRVQEQPKEMTDDDKAALVHQYLTEQRVKKIAMKQQKYKQLITKAF